MTHNFPLAYAVLDQGEAAVKAISRALRAAFGLPER
jgi:hypothetical protein